MVHDPEHEKLEAMAERIRQAEAKPEMSKSTGSVEPLKASRIGFDFIGAVLGCTLLGWLADEYIPGMKPWGLIGMILMGFVVGMFNVWRALSAKQD